MNGELSRVVLKTEKDKTDIKSKHTDILSSMLGELMTEARRDYLICKVYEFKQDLKEKNLDMYLEVNVNYTPIEWKLHDEIINIYKTYSRYIHCCNMALSKEYCEHRSNVVRKIAKEFDINFKGD